eukprot:2710650-Amphidinium_carterae.1
MRTLSESYLPSSVKIGSIDLQLVFPVSSLMVHGSDVLVSMIRDGALCYVSWAECPSKEQEILGDKKNKEW